VAIEQAVTNTSTMSAKLAQMKNETDLAGMQLAEKLGPAMLTVSKIERDVIRGLADLIPYFPLIGKLLVLTAGYVISLNANMIMNNITLKEGIGLKIKDAITMAAWTVQEAIATATIGKLTLATKAAAIAQMLWNTAIKNNPIGLIIGAFTTVIGLLWMYASRVKEVNIQEQTMNNVQKTINEQMDVQSSRVKMLTGLVHDNNLALNDRQKALNELEKIVPDYNASLSKEGQLVNDNTTAIDNYVAALEKKIKMDAYQNELTNMLKKKIEIERWARPGYEASLSPEDKAFNAKNPFKASQAIPESYLNTLKGYTETVQTIKALEDDINGLSSGSDSTTKSGPKKGDKKTEDGIIYTYDGTKWVPSTSGGGGGVNAPNDNKPTDEIDAIKMQDENYAKDTYAKGLMNRIEYEDSLNQIAQQALMKRIEIGKLEPKELAKAWQDLLNLRIADMEKYPQLQGQQFKKIEVDYQTFTDEAGKALHQLAEEEADAAKSSGVTQVKSFKDEMGGIAAWIQDKMKYLEMGANAVSAYSDMENATIEAKYQKQREAAQGNQVALAKIDQDEAQAKLDLQKKTADVNFAINASQIIANTAVSVMKALAELGPIAGPIAAAAMSATGVMELAAAEAEREKVKALTLNENTGVRQVTTTAVTGREEGGSIDVMRSQDGQMFNASYDPSKRGYVNKPTVLVGEGRSGSSLEWVASNAAVKNPTIAPFISMIDIAQRNGTIASFDMNKYFANHVAGFSGGGFIAIGSNPGNQSTAQASGSASMSLDPSIKELIENNNKLLNHLATNGIDASLVYTEWEKKVNLINKSRKLGTL
jgi:hypothetical protein